MEDVEGGNFYTLDWRHGKVCLRDARRKLTAARYATEDFAADAALKVRRHPLRAVSVAMVTGAVVGSLAVFGIGRLWRTRA